MALKYVHRNPKTGLLSYRRAYPADLQPHILNTPQQLKRSLKATRLEEAGAVNRYQVAHQEYETTIAAALKKLKGRYDVLDSPMIKYLADVFRVEWLVLDDELRRSGNECALESQEGGIDWMLSDWREWEARGKLYEIVECWGPQAGQLLDKQSIALAPNDTDTFDLLCFEINKAAIVAAKECLARFNGQRTIDTPEAPQRPFQSLKEPIAAKPACLSFDAICRAYMDNERIPVSESSKESIRTALRFFKDAHGDPSPEAIDALTVNTWLELVATRPAKLPADERALPLRVLQDRYRGRPDVPRLSPKTQEKYVNALSKAWKQSQSTGNIDRAHANPFHGHTFKPVKRPRAPRGYENKELQAIFELPLFQGKRPSGIYTDASYWLPLILLWTGARPEEVAQLVVSDITQYPDTAEWRISFTDEGEHPVKGKRNLKTSGHNTGQREFPIPRDLIRLGLLEYIGFLKSAGHSAVFPTLQSKAVRGLLFTNFGKWWARHLEASKVLPEGRKASREFRHNWATAAHECGLPREAMEYIMGHKDSSTSAHSVYGNRQALGTRIHDIQFKGLDLSRVVPWVSTNRDA